MYEEISVAGFSALPSCLVVGAVQVNVALVLPVTLSVAVPEMLPAVALIVVEPDAIEVARPLEPAALLIVATPVFEELQVADAVTFCVVPLE